MADYKAIKGHTIETVAGDPSVLQAGDIWYNSTLGKVRVHKLGAGAWSSGANNPAPSSLAFVGAFGTATAGVWVGGYVDDASYSDATLEYDGTSWTEGNDLPGTFAAGASGTGIGTLTAGLLCGWYHSTAPHGYLDDTLEYDGTNWTAGGDLPIGAGDGNSSGTQTAGLYITGTSGFPTSRTDQSCEYNGTSWTAGNAVNTIRLRAAGNQVGIQTAGMLVGGNPPSNTPVINVEHYDGTNWSEGTDINTARGNGGGNGISTAAIAYGGGTPSAIGNTESYDGTSWTEVADLSTARIGHRGAGGGVNTSALTTGGTTVATTEVWDGAPLATSNVGTT